MRRSVDWRCTWLPTPKSAPTSPRTTHGGSMGCVTTLDSRSSCGRSERAIALARHPLVPQIEERVVARDPVVDEKTIRLGRCSMYERVYPLRRHHERSVLERREHATVELTLCEPRFSCHAVGAAGHVILRVSHLDLIASL